MLPLSETGGVFQTVLIVLVIIAFFGLLLIQRALKDTSRSPLREAIYMHLYNGLYIDAFITRVLQRVWPGPLSTSKYYGG